MLTIISDEQLPSSDSVWLLGKAFNRDIAPIYDRIKLLYLLFKSQTDRHTDKQADKHRQGKNETEKTEAPGYSEIVDLIGVQSITITDLRNNTSETNAETLIGARHMPNEDCSSDTV